MTGFDTSYIQPARIYKRILALVIDVLIVYLLISFFSRFFYSTRVSTGAISGITSSLNKGLALSFYSILFSSIIFKGQTVGKKIMRIKIVKGNGENIDTISLLNRELLGKIFIERVNLFILLLLSKVNILQGLITGSQKNLWGLFLWYGISLPWLMFFSFAIMVNNKQHKSLHDIVANTIVVDARTGFPEN